MTKQVHALNTISGQVGLVPASYLEHPAFRDQLVEVPEGTKSYESEKYKPQTADEYRASHKEKAAPKKAAEKPVSGEDEATLGFDLQ